MNPAPWQLESNRLILRRLRPDDAATIHSYRALPQVAAYQSWESFELQDAQDMLKEQAGLKPHASGTWLQLGMTLCPTGALVGDCGIHFLQHEPQQVELGITLSPDHQGRGLAREALALVLGYVFDTLGKHRAIATVDERNEPAVRLFRSLGFRQEAHLIENAWFKGAWSSELGFAILKREWTAAASNPATR